MWRQRARIGEHAEAPALVLEDVLRGLACIVGYREGPHAHLADAEAVAVGGEQVKVGKLPA